MTDRKETEAQNIPVLQQISNGPAADDTGTAERNRFEILGEPAGVDDAFDVERVT